jgi:hypothetical protein
MGMVAMRFGARATVPAHAWRSILILTDQGWHDSVEIRS